MDPKNSYYPRIFFYFLSNPYFRQIFPGSHCLSRDTPSSTQSKMAALTILLVVVVGLLTYWIYKLEKLRRNIDKLGGPKALPLIGNVHQLKRSPRGKKPAKFKRKVNIWNVLFYFVYFLINHVKDGINNFKTLTCIVKSSLVSIVFVFKMTKKDFSQYTRMIDVLQEI